MKYFLVYAVIAYTYGVAINGARIHHFLKRFRLRTLKEYSRLACYFAPKIVLSLLTFPLDLYTRKTEPLLHHYLDTLFMKDCLAVLITQKSIDEVHRDYLRPTGCKTSTVFYNESVEEN